MEIVTGVFVGKMSIQGLNAVHRELVEESEKIVAQIETLNKEFDDIKLSISAVKDELEMRSGGKKTTRKRKKKTTKKEEQPVNPHKKMMEEFGGDNDNDTEPTAEEESDWKWENDREEDLDGV
jgi:cobalamin biosynthesis protein CobT